MRQDQFAGMPSRVEAERSVGGFDTWLFRVVAVLTSGILLGVAQPPIPLEWIGVFALIPWILAVWRAPGVGEVVAQSVLLVAAYGAVVIYWLPAALLGVGARPSPGVLTVLGASLWAPLPIFLPAGILLYFARERDDVVSLLAIAFATAALEWVHGHGVLGIPWAHLGHTQIDSEGVSQLARLGGVPLVSMFVMSINVAVARSVLRMDQSRVRIALASLSAWAALHFAGLSIAQWGGPIDPAPPSVQLLVVQPNIPRAERWIPSLQSFNVERAAWVMKAALRNRQETVNAVLWPENLVTSREIERPLSVKRFSSRSTPWACR
ncbi:MAG: hypothetical protein IPK00_21095 [Deltaproteobacteria bacterium]|nr:hypothetical protein [Deltaproteobacteria bacterium]